MTLRHLPNMTVLIHGLRCESFLKIFTAYRSRGIYTDGIGPIEELFNVKHYEINWHKVADHFEKLGKKHLRDANDLQRTRLKYKAPIVHYRSAACFDIAEAIRAGLKDCLLYTSPSPRD